MNKFKLLLLTAFLFLQFNNFVNAEESTPPFKGSFDSWENRPKEKFKNAQENFQRVKSLLLKHYQSSTLDEEQLYYAATQGMLSYLNSGPHSWNKLISPTELQEMQVDLKGQLSGIGIVLKFDQDSGIAHVLDTIPDGPSDKAGIRSGDQLISVDGRFYKGKQFRDMIYDIRGKTGKKVTLKLLRGDKILRKSVTRGQITWKPVEHLMVNKSTGLITIRYFSENTEELVRGSINKLVKQGANSLVLDLRGNSGGLFSQAISTADLFIEKGKTIAKTVGRNNKSETLTAKSKSLTGKMPIVILIDNSTSSGAELFAASLKENNGAKLTGSKTFGKWNAQTVETLPNKFAVKFTVQSFQTPSGKSYENVGISPDVEIAGARPEEPKHVMRKGDGEMVLEKDPQLKTAVNLVKLMI